VAFDGEQQIDERARDMRPDGFEFERAGKPDSLQLVGRNREMIVSGGWVPQFPW
jgi:hypothetical protein